MLFPKQYKCNKCGRKFTSTDGVFSMSSARVECPYCSSRDTDEDYSVFVNIIKKMFKRNTK